MIDKVDQIKDQMDKGELDGRSNLGSMLNSTVDNDLGLQSKSAESKEEGSPSISQDNDLKINHGQPMKKKKTVRKTETRLSSQNQSIRSKDFETMF